ncbi:MAG: hypothetical protein HA494_07665 [Thaumarchaeota archaeon]|nr:hypothetical protein [Nitrososphaerota archaeon]
MSGEIWLEEEVKWRRMKPLQRIEALLERLSHGPQTKYRLYREISGCAPTSLESAIKECLENGLIEYQSELRYGKERKVYGLTNKGRKLLHILRSD